MVENVGNRANLNDALREKVPAGGWQEVVWMTHGKKWTPELLRAALDEYFRYCDNAPLTKDMKMSSKVGGKNEGDEDTQRQTTRPYVMKSLCARLGIADWEKFKAKYCNETSEEGIEFTNICASIENYVGGTLQEGAVAGVYNAKMVMGLTDVAEHVKQEVSGFDGMSDEELRAERDRLLKQMRGESE